MNLKKYHGVVVPMVTPVDADCNIDREAVKKIMNDFARYDVSPLLMGTNGEGNSVSADQGVVLIEAAREAAAPGQTIYAGLAGNCVSEQFATARRYEAAGADVVAATLPSYYLLTPAQMYEYYKNLADFLRVPLMLYNIDITTHMSIPLDVVEKLSHHPNIVGMKDSENNIPRMEEALRLFADREDFAYFCGCTVNSTAALCLGADGIVPSAGNFTPKKCEELYCAGIAHDFEAAENKQKEVMDMSQAYLSGFTLGESIAALKVIMKAKGMCEDYMLPPLTRLSDDKAEEVISKIRNYEYE